MATGMTPSRATITGSLRALILTAALLTPWRAMASEAQDPVDQSDASVISRDLSDQREERPAATGSASVERAGRSDVTASLEPFVAGAIRVEGATELAPADFAAVIEPYLGHPLSRDELARLARDVADVARRAGFGLATAWIPQQEVTNGVLRVRIDEGRIDAVEASGPAAEAVNRVLRRLTNAGPVRTAELERQLLIAGDLSGVSLGRARLTRSEGRNVLRVETALRRVEGRYSLDNWGTASVGPVRARVYVDFNGVATGGDQLSLGASLTPLQPGEFQFVQAGYSVPVGLDGSRLGVRGYASRSRAGAALRSRDLEGKSTEIEASFSHPILRSRAESLWGHVILGVRDSHLTRADVTAREDRIATVTGLLYGWGRVAGGTGRGRVSVVQGLDAFGATEAGDPLASRGDAGGSFTKISAWTEFTRPLGGGFSVELSGEAQLASRPLLASEEMGLGGRAFLRGYDYREFAGDQGVAGSAELRFDLRDLPRPIQRAQLYVYADAGKVTNLRGGAGGGSLASAGGGFRVWLDRRIETGLELGIPLRAGNGGRPDPRLSVTVTGRF
jgi:hemolysin activation/secretion protein